MTLASLSMAATVIWTCWIGCNGARRLREQRARR